MPEPSSKLGSAEDAYKDNVWIETFAGHRFVPEADEPAFDLRDIAHALAYVGRYNGHTTEFISVAEHSIMVSLLMEHHTGGNPMEGLMHDATEAYLSDIPAPFKCLLPDWKAFDKMLETKLRTWAGLPDGKSDGCQQADWLALFIEAFHLMPNKGENYADPCGMRPKALALIEEGWFPFCLEPRSAEERFLKRHEELRLAVA